jgi:PAP_fibrillin
MVSGQRRMATSSCRAAQLPVDQDLARRAALKSQLLGLTRTTPLLGARASSDTREAIDALATQLQEHSCPAAAPLDGHWTLLYTTERDVHSFASLGQIAASQTLDLTGLEVTNRVTTALLRLTAVAKDAEYVPPRRVTYRFSTLHVGLGLNSDAFNFSIDLRRLGVQPGGWSDSVFVDEDLRIARNSRGDLLILQRG